MLVVKVSGGVLSSGIFGQIHALSDQEGLLLGTIRVETEDAISDADINNKNECIIYEIERTIKCPTLRYFYDKKGDILEEKFGELLGDHSLQNVIGWYKSRENTPLSVSFWEQEVHRHLCVFLKNHQNQRRRSQGRPMFGLFTTQQNTSLSNRLINKSFLMLKDHGRWAAMKLNIGNLGNTISLYKQPNASRQPAAPYKAVSERHRESHVDEQSQKTHSVKLTDTLSEEMCSQLQSLCGEVVTSEGEIDTLLEEIDAMRQILCATITHSQNTDDVMESDQLTQSGALTTLSQHSLEGKPSGDVAGASSKGTRVEHLIDLNDYTTENNLTTNSPLVKCSIGSSDSYEHVDIVPDDERSIIVASSEKKPAAMKNNGDAFSFVNDMMQDSKLTPSPKGDARAKLNIGVTPEDSEGENEVVHSPPSSPVY